MISRINPIGPSTPPSGNPPDATSAAQSLDKELAGVSAVLSNVTSKNLDAQLPNIAQSLIALSAQAQKALSVGKG